MIPARRVGMPRLTPTRNSRSSLNDLNCVIRRAGVSRALALSGGVGAGDEDAGLPSIEDRYVGNFRHIHLAIAPHSVCGWREPSRGDERRRERGMGMRVFYQSRIDMSEISDISISPSNPTSSAGA